VAEDVLGAINEVHRRLSLEVLTANTNREIDAAFRPRRRAAPRGARDRPQPVFFLDRCIQLTTHTMRHALPTIFSSRKFAEIGGLMSYAPNSADLYRQAGVYVGRILRGEKPPVIQPTKFELVINAQAARLLGIEVSPTLLAIADEVIEQRAVLLHCKWRLLAQGCQLGPQQVGSYLG
jgi:putative tryptophan/tyrosine transport system substrate-binding protein